MLRTNHHDTPEPTTRATRQALDERQSSQLDTSHPLTEGSTAGPKDAAVSKVEIPQYRRRAILAVWAAAALPMAALAWLVAPAVADRLPGEGNVPMAKALLVCLTVGLIWQFVLVMALVRHEQRSLRWSTLREALWLHSSRGPRSGHIGGRIWLVRRPRSGAVHQTERSLGSQGDKRRCVRRLKGRRKGRALAPVVVAVIVPKYAARNRSNPP